MTQPLPDPTAREYNQNQRQYFEQTLKRTMIPMDTPYLRRHIDQVLRFAGYAPGERVLEVGCGMGRYTLILAARGVNVQGLDLSSVLLERLREFNAGRFYIPLYCADMDELPASLRGAFDLVLGFFTLHHVYDVNISFAAMARLLKPGGRIAFLEPNPLNPLYYFQILFTPRMTWRGERGLVRMRPHVIARAAELAGLKRVTWTRFGFFPPFLANRTWGSKLERVIERVPLWRAFLPFQIFKGERL